MKFKYNKYFILILSLFLGFTGLTKSITYSKEPIEPYSKTSKINMSKLLNNTNWKNICKIWKNFNAAENKNNHNDNYKMMQILEKELPSVANNIDTLYKQGLLNTDQAEYLKSLFNERYHYLEFSLMLVKCYDMSELGYKIAQTRGELEKRYDTIQKLYSENKINSEVFKATSNQIIKDIKFIDDNSYSQKKKTDQSLLELIIYLNK
ncbi:MAG: hypothetical protein AB1782_18985 [Cyanobacteriota bacterium]